MVSNFANLHQSLFYAEMQIYRRISSYANDASLSRVRTDSFPLQLLYRLRTRTPDQPRAHPLSLRRLLNQREVPLAI